MEVGNIPFKNGNSNDWTTERIERLTKQEMDALRANAERLGESALADLCTELLKRARTAVGKAKQKAGTPGCRLISGAKAVGGRGVSPPHLRSSWSGVRKSDGKIVMTIWDAAVESDGGACSCLL